MSGRERRALIIGLVLLALIWLFALWINKPPSPEPNPPTQAILAEANIAPTSQPARLIAAPQLNPLSTRQPTQEAITLQLPQQPVENQLVLRFDPGSTGCWGS